MQQSTVLHETPEPIGIVISGPTPRDAGHAEVTSRVLAYVWGPPPEPTIDAVAKPRAA